MYRLYIIVILSLLLTISVSKATIVVIRGVRFKYNIITVTSAHDIGVKDDYSRDQGCKV